MIYPGPQWQIKKYALSLHLTYCSTVAQSQVSSSLQTNMIIQYHLLKNLWPWREALAKVFGINFFKTLFYFILLTAPNF